MACEHTQTVLTSSSFDSSTSSSSRPRPPFDPFPAPYFLFFAGVEPFLTIIGALKAVLFPAHFHSTLVPASLAPLLEPKTAHAASIMAVRQLGNTYGLLALVASVVLPTMRHTLAGRPAELEACLRAYLVCLAVADVTVRPSFRGVDSPPLAPI